MSHFNLASHYSPSSPLLHTQTDLLIIFLLHFWFKTFVQSIHDPFEALPTLRTVSFEILLSFQSPSNVTFSMRPSLITPIRSHLSLLCIPTALNTSCIVVRTICFEAKLFMKILQLKCIAYLSCAFPLCRIFSQ